MINRRDYVFELGIVFYLGLVNVEIESWTLVKIN